MTASASVAATTMSRSPTVSANRRSDPQYDACVTEGTSSRRETMRFASGRATAMGVRPVEPSRSSRLESERELLFGFRTESL